MAARIHPFSYETWGPLQPFTPNLYGAYYPLPIPAGSHLPVTVFAQSENENHVVDYRELTGSSSQSKPTCQVQGHGKNQLFRQARLDDDRHTQAKRKLVKKHRRRPQRKPRQQKAQKLTGNLVASHSGNAHNDQQRPSIVKTPLRTPYSSRHFLQDVAELNVNPYGTMSGMLELHGDGGGEGCQVGERGQQSSVEGPTSSSSGAEGRGLNAPEEVLQRVSPTVVPGQDLHASLLHGSYRQGDSFLRARLEEQDAHLSQLEEDNLTLKEKLFLVQQELEELRRRTSVSSAEPEIYEGENSVIWGGPCES